MLSPQDLQGLKAIIVGAAREGTALARYLAIQGAQVTLSDTKPAEALQEHLAELEGLDIDLALGQSPPNIAAADVVFISPGVPPTAPPVQRARELGVPLSSEPRLFTQLYQGAIVGITGSSGKTTTTSLVGEMYAAAGRRTWVGGNIGVPLIGKLADEAPPDVAVMELSSFQLELFSPDYQGEAVEARRTEASRVISLAGWSPSIAAITNITPNHLDRHPSMEDYVQAKANIAAYQAPTDWLVLNLDNEITRRMIPEAIAQVLRFSLIEPVADGAFMADDALWLAEDGATEAICRRDEVRLRGVHNIANVLAAACCARAGGVEIEAIRQVATTFAGVAHRLEMVGHWRERTFINDSIATSPERAIAALHSFDEPLVLLAGGRDKHLPWDDWADLVLERARVVVAFGEAVPIIDSALAQARGRRQGGDPALQGVHAVETLEEALERAAAVSRPGDVVLLSPGGTSFDAYKDFEERGRHFRQLVGQLQGTVA